MHIDPKDRKRRKTPKARTGCVQCKRSHTKCGEEKPSCRRCTAAKKHCDYDPVRVWSFASRRGTSVPSPENVQVQPSRALQLHWLPPEDRHALHYYVTRTGPWIANYVPLSSPLRRLWAVTLPRCAHALPATRHVLIAVGLIDEPVPSTDTAKVHQRSQRILHHYNLAIYQLTRPGAPLSPLDLTLTSVLCWLLEVLGFNANMAAMHISAASKLAKQYQDPRLRRLASSKPPEAHGETDDIMSIDVPDLLTFCQSYLATTSASGNRSSPDELNTERAANPVLAALLLRQGACPITEAREFVDAWVAYFTHFQPLLPGGMSLPEAEEYIAYWKVAVVRYRYIMTVPAPIVLLGYLIAAFARCLLPVADDTMSPDWVANEGSLDFILARAVDMTVVEMESKHRLLLEELLSLVSMTVLKFVPNVRQQRVAASVLDGCGHKPDFYAMSESTSTTPGNAHSEGLSLLTCN